MRLCAFLCASMIAVERVISRYSSSVHHLHCAFDPWCNENGLYAHHTFCHAHVSHPPHSASLRVHLPMRTLIRAKGNTRTCTYTQASTFNEAHALYIRRKSHINKLIASRRSWNFNAVKRRAPITPSLRPGTPTIYVNERERVTSCNIPRAKLKSFIDRKLVATASIHRETIEPVIYLFSRSTHHSSISFRSFNDSCSPFSHFIPFFLFQLIVDIFHVLYKLSAHFSTVAAESFAHVCFHPNSKSSMHPEQLIISAFQWTRMLSWN